MLACLCRCIRVCFDYAFTYLRNPSWLACTYLPSPWWWFFSFLQGLLIVADRVLFWCTCMQENLDNDASRVNELFNTVCTHTHTMCESACETIEKYLEYDDVKGQKDAMLAWHMSWHSCAPMQTCMPSWYLLYQPMYTFTMEQLDASVEHLLQMRCGNILECPSGCVCVCVCVCVHTHIYTWIYTCVMVLLLAGCIPGATRRDAFALHEWNYWSGACHPCRAQTMACLLTCLELACIKSWLHV